ncbi:cache domain-containing protein [Desulfobacter curvatus]|uniref:cache domain-containing protein n=1 Tax=Desulfobacter curvatus TaxID=2290 RepID=UPI0003814C86|nr:cache domain-containing protein [Desulfobacter curvatus]
MLDSKILRKAIFIVGVTIFLFILIIYAFTMPKIEKSIQALGEENSKVVLSKVVMLAKNVHQDLESFKARSMSKHKDQLKDLTHVAWSVIDSLYEQSKMGNIGNVLQARGEQFKRNLDTFYSKNKDRLPHDQLKEKIANYIRIHRYDNDSGYYFVNDFDSNSVIHPIKPAIEGTSFKNIEDKNGVYYVNKMVDIAKKNGAGILDYRWENPTTGKVEDKISYVFKFEPFDWIVGTGAYYSELNKKLMDEVFHIISHLHYSENGYFFIFDYDGIMQAHPFVEKEADFSQVRDSKGNLIGPPMVKTAREQREGFYSYWWKKKEADEMTYQKLSFVRDFPNWDLVIGTGIYIDDIETEIAKRKAELIHQLRQLMLNTKIGKT